MIGRRQRQASMFQTHQRQLDFFNPELHNPHITVIGAGGIGSPTVLQLVKLGVRRIRVYDRDLVEIHNLATTPYTREYLGKPKVVALAAIAQEHGYGKMEFVALPRHYDGKQLPKTDILVSAVDSMPARRLLWQAVRKYSIPFFVDGRIGAENLRVYSIDPADGADCSLYESSLYPPEGLTDEEWIVPLPCTGQQIVDVGWVTASLIVRAIRQWVVFRGYTPEIIYKWDRLMISKANHKGPAPWEELEAFMRIEP